MARRVALLAVAALAGAAHAGTILTPGTYSTEMIGMSLTGSSPIGPISITESATHESNGVTEIEDDSGTYHIDSFFDVWTELSFNGSPGVEVHGLMQLDDDGVFPASGFDWTPGPGQEPIPPVGGTYYGHPIIDSPSFYMTFAWHQVTSQTSITLLPDGLTLEEIFDSLLTYGLDFDGDHQTDWIGTASGPTTVHVTIPAPGAAAILIGGLAIARRRR